jgi:hypothetical protein
MKNRALAWISGPFFFLALAGLGAAWGQDLASMHPGAAPSAPPAPDAASLQTEAKFSFVAPPPATAPAHRSPSYPSNHYVFPAILSTARTDVGSFYVALPFDDLAHPEISQKWVPSDWVRKPLAGGGADSACFGHWLELINDEGDTCYAQWEGAGPPGFSEPGYVFGGEPSQGPGMAVSPMVAAYLNLGADHPSVGWRFVKDEEVAAGLWLKYNEEAVLFRAMRQSSPKNSPGVSGGPALRALYLQAYLEISDGEKALLAHREDEARAQYTQAASDLEKLMAMEPGNAPDLAPKLKEIQQTLAQLEAR